MTVETSSAMVLVVDDDPTVAEVVMAYLERAGLRTVTASNGLRALQVIDEEHPDLVVLDLMLPDLDGIEVCRRLRLSGDTPVIMLTALGDEVDRVLGLEVGADDYLVKPFSPRELVLRAQSVLRRSSASTRAGGQPSATRSLMTDGDLRLDVDARTAECRGTALSLTAREFDLLAYFVSKPNKAFTREQLMSDVWGWSFGDQSTITVHVRRLREKVEEHPSNPLRLVTVWGVGYRWNSPASRQDLQRESDRARA